MSPLRQDAQASTYLPQLDGLRALAVLSVMQHHWAPSITKSLPLALGSAGVQLFFVISGFLITGILMRARERATAQAAGRGGVLRAFYARRALRIFPLYYMTIGVLWALGYAPVRDHLLSLLTYTFNIELSLSGEWVAGISHLWSLAVEEQFYLIWPWLVLFLPRRGLIVAGAGLIVAAPVVRILHHTFWTDQFNTLLLFENTDGLCLGALLAVLGVHSAAGRKASRSALGWGGGAILLTMLVLGLFEGRVYVVDRIAWSVQQLGMVAVFTWLVRAAACGLPGPVGRLLTWRPVVYLGTISYGLYVYHLLLMHVWTTILRFLGLPRSLGAGPVRLLLLFLLTLALATLSWYLIERPINRRKSRFPYVTGDGEAGRDVPKRPAPGREMPVP